MLETKLESSSSCVTFVLGAEQVVTWFREKKEEGDGGSVCFGNYGEQVRQLLTDVPPPSVTAVSRRDTQLLSCHGQAGGGEAREAARAVLTARRPLSSPFSSSAPAPTTFTLSQKFATVEASLNSSSRTQLRHALANLPSPLAASRTTGIGHAATSIAAASPSPPYSPHRG